MLSSDDPVGTGLSNAMPTKSSPAGVALPVSLLPPEIKVMEAIDRWCALSQMVLVDSETCKRMTSEPVNESFTGSTVRSARQESDSIFCCSCKRSLGGVAPQAVKAVEMTQALMAALKRIFDICEFYR